MVKQLSLFEFPLYVYGIRVKGALLYIINAESEECVKNILMSAPATGKYFLRGKDLFLESPIENSIVFIEKFDTSKSGIIFSLW